MSGSKAGKSVLSGRYARALFDLATKEKALEQVDADLNKISEMLSSSEDLRKVIASPVIPKDSLQKSITEIFKKSEISKLTVQFSAILSENGRLSLLGNIAEEFSHLLAEARGDVEAEVTVASKLDNKELDGIKSRLQEATGKNVSLKQAVNKDILGGLIVRVGSKMLDDSISGRLERMRLHLKTVEN